MKSKKPQKSGFMTRTQAVRHLQISLADFRRLCILKGVYPRDVTGKPKKGLVKGSTKPVTAYYRKDIQYLLHEPLICKFRDHKIFARKLSRALGRGDLSDARRIDENRPRYTLDHVIRERYPTFTDALGDLDDALSMVFLFANFPATDHVSARVTQDAERLSNEWMAYISRQHALKKVFISIKGAYYAVNIRGQEIRFLVPFKFPQNVPTDVDFKVMLTFLEFYTTLLHFVLYRLYTDAGLVYPAPINPQRANGIGGISSYILDSEKPKSLLRKVEVSSNEKVQNVDISLDKARAADGDAQHSSDDEGESNDSQASNDEDQDEEELDKFEAEEGDGDQLAQPDAQQSELLFSKFTFLVGREVSIDLVEVMILAFGGKLVSQSALDELVNNEDETAPNSIDESKVDLSTVTHQICDRPMVSSRVPGRIYIQPQWIFDSINSGKLLPVSDYAPGEKLPAHLSPWGDRGLYNPQQADEEEEEEGLEESFNSNVEESEAEEAQAGVEPISAEAEELDSEDEAQQELQLEASGVAFSEAKQKAPPKRKTRTSKTEDEKELRKMMMSSKKKNLYDRMQYGNEKKQAREDALRKKRRKLEQTKKTLEKS